MPEAARDLTHPEYGHIFWVCVLTPGEEMFATKVRQLLTEAHELAVSKYKRKAARQ
ncbi:hypothetical protein KDW_41840 [Dictyobacter vulcani]|uniref:DUF6194 domain-containing protein n=1 Tax=Dictyobacter vulcani TaxID=2607529 RepID=A0A5J4KSC9_9CHLR|nr:DUF6194 family protein [Dictyobacter vulcani]GER90022.1 hypothetical protein KDW_41840 [Dictyobacter vulcani]